MSRVAERVAALPAIDISDAALARVTSALAETAERYDRSGAFPRDGIAVVHDAGLLRLGIGGEWGGSPFGAVDGFRVFTALGKGDPSVAIITAMSVIQHSLQSARPWWPEDLYRQVVSDSVERPVLLNAVRAEPEWGAPARGGLPATTIARTAGGWSLNGRKGYATGSEGLAFHLVWAATDEADPLIAHAIVPADAAGIQIVRTWDHLGLRASSTHDVIYSDVEIPFENFVGVRVSELTKEPPFAGVSPAGLYLGVAQAARDFFVTFANDRIPTSLGRPIATTERIRTVAGEIEAHLTVATEVALGVARRQDAGEKVPASLAVLASTLVSRSSIAAVQAAISAIGNPGLTRHNPLERHWRDVQASRVHPPQEDAALLAAGTLSLSTPR